MFIPREIGRAADKLKAGRRWVKRITVRELLAMFKAERRGTSKVQEIRAALDHLGLKTDPDFESAWIDSLVRIQLKDPDQIVSKVDEIDEGNESPSVESEEVDEAYPAELESAPVVNTAVIEEHPTIVPIPPPTEGVVEIAVSEPTRTDPTFRIGNFPAANKKLITVGPDDPLNKAITRMLQYDFSQLPIMQGERDVKGVVSWRSVGARYAMGVKCETAKDARDDAQVIDANGTLFDAIGTIVKHGYVLVRNQRDRRVTGIVTASDLSLQFQQLTEPFILLREIELHIRRLLQGKITKADLDSYLSPEVPGRHPNSVADLTFGEYIRLFQHPAIWTKLALNIDRVCLIDELEKVREIRNDVMHFDPDPMTQKQLDILKDAAKFMQQLFELLPT